MRSLILVALVALSVVSSAEAGESRYVRQAPLVKEHSSIYLKSPVSEIIRKKDRIHRPEKVEIVFPKIPKDKDRYVTNAPKPTSPLKPKFSVLFNQKTLPRALCYDPIRKVWQEAGKPTLEGSVNVGRVDSSAVVRKGTLYCTFVVPE